MAMFRAAHFCSWRGSNRTLLPLRWRHRVRSQIWHLFWIKFGEAYLGIGTARDNKANEGKFMDSSRSKTPCLRRAGGVKLAATRL